MKELEDFYKQQPISEAQRSWGEFTTKASLPFFYKLITEHGMSNEGRSYWLTHIARGDSQMLLEFLCVLLEEKIRNWGNESAQDKRGWEAVKKEMEKFFKEAGEVESSNELEKETIEHFPKRWKEAIRGHWGIYLKGWSEEIVAYLCDGFQGRDCDSIYYYFLDKSKDRRIEFNRKRERALKKVKKKFPITYEVIRSDYLMRRKEQNEKIIKIYEKGEEVVEEILHSTLLHIIDFIILKKTTLEEIAKGKEETDESVRKFANNLNQTETLESVKKEMEEFTEKLGDMMITKMGNENERMVHKKIMMKLADKYYLGIE